MRYLTGLHPRRGRGEGRRAFRPVPGRRGRGRRPRRLPLHDPGSPRGPGRPAVRGVQRPAGSLAGAGRLGRARSASASRPGSCRTRRGAARRGRTRTVELVPSRAGSRRTGRSRNPPSSNGSAAACAVADRALATLLPEIRPGVTEADAGAPARMADPDRRRRGARLRRRLPGRARGGAAARRARRPAGRRGAGPALRLRRAGGRLPERHDADAVRRRPDRRATWRSTSWWRVRRRRRSRRSRRPWLVATGTVGSAERPRDRRGGARGHRAGRAWRPLRPRDGSRHRAGDARGAVARQVGRRTSRCRARRCSRWSPASTWTVGWASASRTWSLLDAAARRRRTPDQVPARDPRRRGQTPAPSATVR